MSEDQRVPESRAEHPRHALQSQSESREESHVVTINKKEHGGVDSDGADETRTSITPLRMSLHIRSPVVVLLVASNSLPLYVELWLLKQPWKL